MRRKEYPDLSVYENGTVFYEYARVGEPSVVYADGSIAFHSTEVCNVTVDSCCYHINGRFEARLGEKHLGYEDLVQRLV